MFYCFEKSWTRRDDLFGDFRSETSRSGDEAVYKQEQREVSFRFASAQREVFILILSKTWTFWLKLAEIWQFKTKKVSFPVIFVLCVILFQSNFD